MNRPITSPAALLRLGALATTLALAACGGGGDAPGTGASPGPSPIAAPSPSPAPAAYTVSVTVTTVVAGGESFSFGLGGQTVSVTASGAAAAFGGALAAGSSYTVSQLSGPRTCTLSGNRTGTIVANVSVTASCGAPASGSLLGGRVYGPQGAQVLLRNNGADDLPVTVATSASIAGPYNVQDFSFATALPDGAAYAVTVAGASTHQTCRPYLNATGTMPVAAGALRVGCEFTFDHVSRSSNGETLGTYYESDSPVLGGASVGIGKTGTGYGEGRFVAFVSSVPITGTGGGNRQVYWRDRFTDDVYLVSANAAGVAGNNNSFAPAISADGLTVAFESFATNLDGSDGNGVRDVFIWSAMNPTAGARRVSVGAANVEADGESYAPTLSGDGSVIAFSSRATNLVAGVAGTGTVNVVRRDLVTGTTTLISKNAAGTAVGGEYASLSEDGQRLAFWSYALTPAGDTNGLWDIFVYDHATGTAKRVSLAAGGGERNQGDDSASRVVAPVISGNGRFVAYATSSTNVVPDDTNGEQDVFVVDVDSGAVARASTATGGAQGNAASPIGQGERLGISYDGRWVSFTSTATNLGTATTTTGIGNAFLHDMLTGETRGLSDQLASGSVGPTAMSRDGGYVVFGAAGSLDPRFASSGLFVRFTGNTRAFFWVVD